jgi:Cys-tRNA(Pro) deacylase
LLRKNDVTFSEHHYRYETHGGTRVSARELGTDEHAVIKTLVMEDEHRQPLIVLMHGDCEVSTKELARQIGRKATKPCEPATAQKHTGYMVGGTSPFGTRRPYLSTSNAASSISIAFTSTAVVVAFSCLWRRVSLCACSIRRWWT